MSVLSVRDVGGYLHFDETECRVAGAARNAEYQSASPFPHITINDFIDRSVLLDLLGEFPNASDKEFFDRAQERLKFQFAPHEISGRRLRNFVAELNSPAFLGFLEEMTGISKLIPDPYYEGGGLHETRRGGHLGVHTDFNIHKRLNIERRLNVLIYLNDDWDESYGGALELWDRDMTACQVKISPLIGRAVVFTTTLESYHGHPDPLVCPPDRTRRSIATYYYTANDLGVSALPDRTTAFRQRPNSSDRKDWHVSLRHLANDWLPPAVRRVLRSEKR